AVRLKLDQKINHGRLKILFDVTRFAIDHPDSVKALHSVLRYAVQRGTTIGLFGLKQTLWIKLAEGFPSRLNLFELESEAVKWLEKVVIQPKGAPAVPKKPDPDEEIKQRRIQELLAKYAIYQAQNDYDPFLLRKLADEYVQTPAREPLFALRRAYKNIFSLKESLAKLEGNCRNLANLLYESMRIRKIPLSPPELMVKRKSVQDTRAAVQSELDEIKKEVDKYMAVAVDFRKRSIGHEERWKNELELLQKQIDQQTVENKKLMSILNG
ncbi:MAG TPA: hypothetical protein VFV50_06215, partial [Bdellovibrionales bacterium]|nr:hypothetical protein [Bdellovibrionales bacterium]